MAKQIITFNITKLLVGAHYDFHYDIYSYINAATPEALHIETQTPPYYTAVELYFSISISSTLFTSPFLFLLIIFPSLSII